MADLKAVRLLVLDFDGTMTDDAVYVDQDGIETVRCLRADGYGIARLQAAGVPVVVVSAEVNPVVAARCQKLGITCHQGVTNKLSVVLSPLKGIPTILSGSVDGLVATAYMGNDENDLGCLRAVGFPFVPSSAEHVVKVEALKNGWHITKRAGGYGAVREVCDLILAARGGI